MSSPEPTAVGKPTATVRLDEKDAALLARFIAADGVSLFEYPSKEEVSGKKGKKDQGRRRANRDTRNLSALETLESGSANRQPAEPDEQSVAMQAEIIRLDQRGVPWHQGLIQLKWLTPQRTACPRPRRSISSSLSIVTAIRTACQCHQLKQNGMA